MKFDKMSLKKNIRPLITIAVLVFLCIVFSIMKPAFLSGQNMMSILIMSVTVGIIAVGECICIISGYSDLSSGMVAALSGLLAAVVVKQTGSALLAVIAGLVLGVVCGAISGFLVSYLKMNSFITTFALQTVYRGIIYITTDGYAIDLYDAAAKGFTKWGQYRIFGILQFPIFIMLLIYIISALLLKYRRIGREIYISGGNPKCAHICGINLHKIQMFVFIYCNLLASIAGMLYASRMERANAFLSDSLVLEAIAAAVVGGTSMAGGKGNLVMTFVGVLIVYVVKNGLVMVGLPDYYQYCAVGLILFLAVAVQKEKKTR